MPPRITDFTSLARGGGAGKPPNTAQQRPLTARGEVVVAPASESSDMTVLITSVQGVQQPGIVVPAGNWSPRGTTLPAKGATCLIVFDDLGDAFVPVWSGATAFPPDPDPAIARGVATQTYSNNTGVGTNVTHGLGATPVAVVATFDVSSCATVVEVSAFTATTFHLTTVVDSSGVSRATGTATVYWVAVA